MVVRAVVTSLDQARVYMSHEAWRIVAWPYEYNTPYRWVFLANVR